MDGDTVVVGAPRDDTAAGEDAGSAYVFVRSGPFWSQQAKLTASDGATKATFRSFGRCGRGHGGGRSAAGQYGRGEDAGSAYVFVRRGPTGWSQQAKLTSSEAAASDKFGFSVSVDGDTVVVGSREDNTRAGGHNAGSAYVFVRSGTSWSQQAKLTASDGADNDAFGYSVSVDGDTVAVGAVTGHSTASVNAGAAYVFVRSGRTSWTQQAKLDASDGADWDYFGCSVSVDGDTVVVGAPEDDTAAGINAGAAYVFVRSEPFGLPIWIQQAKLTASDGGRLGPFGESVSVDGHTIVVGAPRHEPTTGIGRQANRLPHREATLPSGLIRCPRMSLVLGSFPTSRAIFDHLAMLYRQDVLDAGRADALIANLETAVEALDKNDAAAAHDQFAPSSTRSMPTLTPESSPRRKDGR